MWIKVSNKNVYRHHSSLTIHCSPIDCEAWMTNRAHSSRICLWNYHVPGGSILSEAFQCAPRRGEVQSELQIELLPLLVIPQTWESFCGRRTTTRTDLVSIYCLGGPLKWDYTPRVKQSINYVTSFKSCWERNAIFRFDLKCDFFLLIRSQFRDTFQWFEPYNKESFGHYVLIRLRDISWRERGREKDREFYILWSIFTV